MRRLAINEINDKIHHRRRLVRHLDDADATDLRQPGDGAGCVSDKPVVPAHDEDLVVGEKPCKAVLLAPHVDESQIGRAHV